ncbi:hypothetical protein PV325_003802 [Microctonus aethiopoides]|uniref:N-alpha-acetyltransferase 40 n=1 Tax=Microctonus aethiopoides TaxID=144406 RepID=A0AA39F8B7_9HYME|nr:hypothetical protein PV325_003802 [Microctonus aethiopoides]KAK0097620.1 hypothetical protein PV326_000583 [Microctonus aethiopoides]KAK0164689.1 hypothetical protein PV328_003283 [Microctonus aethiopoides]
MKNKKGHRTRKQIIAEKEALSKRLIEIANSQNDPLVSLPLFQSYKSSTDIQYKLTCQKVKDLDSKTLAWIFDLMERNMKTIYQQSNWGWNESSKQNELTEPTAWYLIASCNEEPVGFSHFRYDIDDKVQVLYCYELQLEPRVRRNGLGKFMMNCLDALASQSGMKKVVLTVLKHNPAARLFFKSLGFKLDNTSPPEWENLDYIILSK